jgi:hypothetical protein
MAAGVREAIADTGESTGLRLAGAAVLGTGAALFWPATRPSAGCCGS